MGRSDRAKLLQSGSSLSCSEVAFSGTTRPFSNFDFWRQGLPKPSEGVTLPSRVRLTPRGVVPFEKTNDVTNSFQSNIVWNRSF